MFAKLWCRSFCGKSETLCRFIVLSALCVAWVGCVTTTGGRKLVVPIEPGEKTCTLVLENPMMGTLIGKFGLSTTVAIDGFTPIQWGTSNSGEATTFKLPAGNHQLVVLCVDPFSNNQVYMVEFLAINFDAGADKVYRIKVQGGDFSMREFIYRFSYEGWSNDESADWPVEKVFKSPSPLFGLNSRDSGGEKS